MILVVPGMLDNTCKRNQLRRKMIQSFVGMERFNPNTTYTYLAIHCRTKLPGL
jgi:hypothetical protein